MTVGDTYLPGERPFTTVLHHENDSTHSPGSLRIICVVKAVLLDQCPEFCDVESGWIHRFLTRDTDWQIVQTERFDHNDFDKAKGGKDGWLIKPNNVLSTGLRLYTGSSKTGKSAVSLSPDDVWMPSCSFKTPLPNDCALLSRLAVMPWDWGAEMEFLGFADRSRIPRGPRCPMTTYGLSDPQMRWELNDRSYHNTDACVRQMTARLTAFYSDPAFIALRRIHQQKKLNFKDIRASGRKYSAEEMADYQYTAEQLNGYQRVLNDTAEIAVKGQMYIMATKAIP